MTSSTRGRLTTPKLDNRTWQDIVDEARALIPRYAPQWTDHNSSDVGITLVELFAWLSKGSSTASTRCPSATTSRSSTCWASFAIPRRRHAPMLTFTAAPSAPATGAPVPAGTRVQTRGTDADPPIVFETDTDLAVLPVGMPTALFIGKALFQKYSNVSSDFTLPPADGTTLRIAPGASVMLLLGFDGATTKPIKLDVALYKPVRRDPVTNVAQVLVSWHESTGTTAPTSWPQVGSVGDGTDGLVRDGVVTLVPSATWAAQVPSQWQIPPASARDVVVDSLRWVGVRLANPGPRSPRSASAGSCSTRSPRTTP